MLLVRICVGYPVRAEARASVECESMTPMLFFTRDSHARSRTRLPFEHTRAPIRVHCVSARIRALAAPPPPPPPPPFFYTRIPALC